MKRVLGALLLVVGLVAGSAGSANAGYCGAGTYRACRPAACTFAGSYCTVMKTCQKVVYEQQQMTCYKTVYDRVPVTRRVLCTKYVPEVRQKQVAYTVCRPVWETRQKVVNYTVRKPVYETRQKQVPFTVCKPVYEQRVRNYTVNKPVWETRQKVVDFTVCKPVGEPRQT